MKILNNFYNWLNTLARSVPVRLKIIGIGLIPVVILGLALNYWVTSSLADWLSHLLIDVRVQAAMDAGRRSVTLVTILTAAVSVFISLFLSHVLSRQILALREMAQKVASGQLEARARVWAGDEIGQLAIAINTMTDHLVSNQKDLARTNRRLDAINQIALASDESAEIHDVLYVILQKLLVAFRLQVGWVYLLDPERQKFHLASWAGMPDEIGQILIRKGEHDLCSCRKVILEKRDSGGITVQPCELLRNGGYQGELTSHLTIPLEARGQILGVINLLCNDEAVFSQDDMELLTSISAQISEVVANAWLRLKLREKELARQALLESLVRAQEEERRRLARELHDGAGQTLTSLLVRLKTLENQNSDVELAPSLISMQEIVSEIIEQIRGLSYRLRPAALEEFGLSTALETLVQETAQNSGLQVNCDCCLADCNLSEEVEVTLYRIGQEGLTNVLHHASANEVRLTLQPVADGIQLCIEDDGIGFNPDKIPSGEGIRHLGLVSMRERAEMLDGTLDVYTAPNQGTTIQVYIPLKEVVYS